jgi:hypothetical protein
VSLDLVRDVLDKQMLDRRLRHMGKVDGIVLELREGMPPRVIGLEAGVTVLGQRLGQRPGRWMARLARRLSPERPGAFRVPWPKVQQIDLAVHVDLDAEQLSVYALERWLRRHVVGRIPGSGAPRMP